MYFFNIHEGFTAKQMNIIGNFAEFWQKTNIKMLILSVYNEVKTKYIYNQVYSYDFNEENHPAFKTDTNRSLRGSYN